MFEEYETYHASYFRRRFLERRIYALHKLGGKCVDCGSVDNLHFDHVKGDTKVGNISEMLASSSLAILDTELAKCELRCNTCHGHRHKGYAQHGTLSRNRTCNCTECKAAKAAYMKEYMRKYRARS